MREETVSERLVAFSRSLAFDMLPVPVVEKAKLLLLDTVGICVGSSGFEFGRAITAMAERFGGAPECTVIGGGRAVPARYAALANGVLAHGQDYDDTHTGSLVHSSGVLVPATLAAAERFRLPGREAIAALAVGTEIAIRLAMPARHSFNKRGFQTTTAVGTFASSLIAARGAGLDADTTLQAVGIVGSLTSGLMECIPAAATAKQIHPGWAAHCGFMATEFAQAGFTGPATIFEGRLGLFSAFLHGEDVDLAPVFADLGERWDMLDVRPKLYPCGHPLNSFIDCAAVLRAEIGGDAGRIRSVRCEPAADSISMICDPWEKKLSPATGYDARFSLPYAVAVMLVHGRAGIEEFSDEALRDPKVKALMRTVTFQPNPEFQVKDMPARIVLQLEDGREIAHEVPRLRGDSQSPIATEELMAKFYANTGSLPRPDADRIADAILALEAVEDMGDFALALRGSDPASPQSGRRPAARNSTPPTGRRTLPAGALP